MNAVKREQFPWMLEVTKNAPQMAIIQLGEAFKNFFAGRAKYPKFRKKGVRDQPCGRQCQPCGWQWRKALALASLAT